MAALFGPLLLAIRGGVQDMQLMYVLQHGAIHLALGWSFAITLRPGSTPLISALARGLHTRLGQDFTPALAHYTRRLTALWVAYFVGMVAVSALIFWLAPWPVWSVFGNLVTPLAAAALFVGEYLLRYRWHPEFARITLRAAFEAYQHSGRGAGS